MLVFTNCKGEMYCVLDSHVCFTAQNQFITPSRLYEPFSIAISYINFIFPSHNDRLPTKWFKTHFLLLLERKSVRTM